MGGSCLVTKAEKHKNPGMGHTSWAQVVSSQEAASLQSVFFSFSQQVSVDRLQTVSTWLGPPAFNTQTGVKALLCKLVGRKTRCYFPFALAINLWLPSWTFKHQSTRLLASSSHSPLLRPKPFCSRVSTRSPTTLHCTTALNLARHFVLLIPALISDPSPASFTSRAPFAECVFSNPYTQS
jgi:hypothetical protein